MKTLHFYSGAAAVTVDATSQFAMEGKRKRFTC